MLILLNKAVAESGAVFKKTDLVQKNKEIQVTDVIHFYFCL